MPFLLTEVPLYSLPKVITYAKSAKHALDDDGDMRTILESVDEVALSLSLSVSLSLFLSLALSLSLLLSPSLSLSLLLSVSVSLSFCLPLSLARSCSQYLFPSHPMTATCAPSSRALTRSLCRLSLSLYHPLSLSLFVCVCVYMCVTLPPSLARSLSLPIVLSLFRSLPHLSLPPDDGDIRTILESVDEVRHPKSSPPI